MRSILLFACLCFIADLSGQGNGFTFTYTGPNQINVGTSCMAPLLWGHPNTPTVSSNIPGGMIVSFNIYSISGGYHMGDQIHGGTTVTVFYQAVDNFGNNALFGFSIVFVDLLPPVFDPLSLPHNITVSCSNNLPPPANVEATDNCAGDDPPLTITYTQTGNVAVCAGGTITRRWVADDDGGNQATFVQTITITPDMTPPVIANNLVNGTAPCATAMAQYTTWLNTQRANFTATDAGCGLMTKSDNAPPPAQITSFCGVIEVTFTAKDNCNNTSTVVKTFTVTNNVPPVIVNPASGAMGNCGQANIAQIFNNWINTHGGATATDDCSSIFWTTSPASPSIADTCDAAIPVLFIASDGCNNFDTTSASFVLIDDTAPAITTAPSTVVLSCSSPTVDSLLMDWLVTGGHSAAHDLCTPNNQLQLGYRINDEELTLQDVLNAWQDSLASDCRDGVIINGIGINNVKALLEVEFTYDDNCDNEGGATAFFGITDNGRPVFDTMPSNASYVCASGQPWQQVFGNWYNSAGNADYSDLCSDVIVHPNITLDSAITYLAAALDTACAQGAFVTIQFSLQDDCGNASLTSPSATFTLQDTMPPGFTHFASDLIADCGQNTQTQLQNWFDTLGGASAIDGCGELSWTFNWTDTSGMSQAGTPFNGPYPQVGDLGCNEAIEIIFMVMDPCQNAAADTAVFMVTDTTGPVIMIVLDTLLLSCTDSIPGIQPMVSDVCDPNPLVTYQDSSSTNVCLGHPDFVQRTWTAIDACGNSSTAQMWFISSDTIAPTFDLPTDTVSFCSIDTLILLNVADNCDPSPTVTWNDVLSGQTCDQQLSRTWIVTDACGNSSTAIQNFDLSDETPPVITYSPGNFVFACDASFPSLQAAYEQWQDSVVITDGCSASDYFIAQSGSYVLEDTSTWPGLPLPDSIMLMCGQNMTVVGDLVAYDDCGNVIVENISFSVNDTVGPVFTNCVAVVNVFPDTTCTGLASLTVPDFEEICFPDDVSLFYSLDGGDTISVDTILVIDTILPVGVHEMLWIAEDCNGNIGTCETSIQIIDENALMMTCPPDTLLFTNENDCAVSLFVHAPQTTLGTCGLGAIYWHGFIVGNAEPDSFVFHSPDDSLLVNFIGGVHQVYLISADSTGDIDTCFYVVELRDTFPPEIQCQSDTLFLPPSGLESISVATSSLVASVSDACGIDTIAFMPDSVDCSMNGQEIMVEITVKDYAGNSSTCSALLYIATLPLSPSWERGLCNDTLRLFANVPLDTAAHYTYTWTGPNSFLSNDENPVLPGSDSTFSGTYILVVQSGNGCTSTGSVQVVIMDLVSPVITISEDTICVGETISLNSQAFSGNIIYQWYHVLVSGDTLLGQTSEPQFIYTPPAAGDYTFYAVIRSDSCSSAPGEQVHLNVQEVPVAEIADLPAILCITDSLFLSPVDVVDSLHYQWTGPGGYISNVSLPAGIPAEVIDTFATYYLSVANNYCTSLLDSITVTIQPVPPTPVITGDAQSCVGGNITMVASGNGESYLWLDPQSNVITTLDSALSLMNVDTSFAGSWHVISFINGCASDTSDAFSVSIDTAIAVEILTAEMLCEGDSVELHVEPPIAGVYSWSGPNGFVSDETVLHILAIDGLYHLDIMTATGCVASDDVDIQVFDVPQIDSLITDADSCVNGTAPITISAISSPGFHPDYIYHWSGPGTFVSQDSSIVFQNGDESINGTYYLFIENGICQSAADSLTLSVTNSPAVPEVSGSNVYCFGDTIKLFITSPIAGASYTWSSNDTTLTLASPGTLILPNATINQTGLYHVSVNVNGCESANANFAIQVKSALPPAIIGGTSFVCEGDSLILQTSVPPGAMITWTGPNSFTSSSTEVIISPATPLNAGDYFVSYTSNGCNAEISSAFHVDIQSAVPIPLITSELNSLCIDDPVPVTICIDPVSLTQGGIYSWYLNGNTPIGTPGSDSCITFPGDLLQGGENFISVVSSFGGCISDTSEAVFIEGDEIPSLIADAGPSGFYCPGEPIFLQGSDAHPGTGAWSTSDPLVIFSQQNNPHSEVFPLPSGPYTLYWTLTYHTCINYSTDSVVITVITPPLAFADTVNVPFGQTAEFVVTLNDSLSLQPYTLEILVNPAKGNALHAGNGIIRYTPNIGFVGTDMMTYRICSIDCPDECSETTVVLHVGNDSDCFIPTLFTPNEDGINDELIIPCLETSKYPDNKIIIFNEWGGAVFTASPYENNWDGTVSGNALPVGTYFYIMDFGDGSSPKRSFLVLER